MQRWRPTGGIARVARTLLAGFHVAFTRPQGRRQQAEGHRRTEVQSANALFAPQSQWGDPVPQAVGVRAWVRKLFDRPGGR